MNVSVRKRARQRASLMQAELDGRSRAIATPAFIAPAHPDELIPYERALRSAQRDVGDHYAGPFDSEERAQAVAIERLTAGRKRPGPTGRNGE
jgi:hypothetical protein